MSLAIWGCWPVEIQYVYGQCSKPAEKICLKFQNFPELDWKRINCPFSTPATPAGPGWLQLAARLCKWRTELRRGAIWWPVQESPLFCSTTGGVPCSQMKAWEHQMYPAWIWEIPQEVRTVVVTLATMAEVAILVLQAQDSCCPELPFENYWNETRKERKHNPSEIQKAPGSGLQLIY